MSQMNDGQAAIAEEDDLQEQQPAPQGLMDQARQQGTHETTNEENEDTSISHLDNTTDKGESVDEINWAEIERPDHIPEKFWNESNGPDLESMGKSLMHLERKLSEKAPERYDTGVFENANIPTDDPLAGYFVSWCKQNGVKQSSFNELAEKVIGNQVANDEASQETIAEQKALLGENADAIITSNLKWADSLLEKGVISEAEHEEIDIWGGTAAGSSLLQKVRAMTGENINIPTQAVQQHSQSKDEFDAEIQEMMKDKRYGVDKAYTNTVERKFEERFGKK